MSIELGSHQLGAIRDMHNGCILTGGVGTGKTRTTMAYYVLKVCGGRLKINGKGSFGEMTTPKDIYVITTAKKRDDLDWETEAIDFRVSTDPKFSVSGVKIVVDSWNNIDKYSGIKDAFFVFDEQRLVGRGAWVKAFLKIAKANEWVLLSATPGDTWMDYAPVFLANGFYKNITEFTRTHVVYSYHTSFPKIDRYVEVGRLEKYRRQLIVEMPYERHTKRIVRNVICEYDKATYERATKDRWHPFEGRPIKDIGELFRVWRKIVNTDPSRLAAVMELMEKHPRLIVWYNSNDERDMLLALGGSLGVPFAEWSGHNHQEIPDTDRWLYFVQYTAGAEGWNCISTDAMIFFSLNYSFKIFEQAKGRIDRLNTPFVELYYYVLRSSAPIDSAIVRSLATKENFNERKYAAVFAQKPKSEAKNFP